MYIFGNLVSVEEVYDNMSWMNKQEMAHLLENDDLIVCEEDSLSIGRGYRAEKFKEALNLLLENYHSLSTEEIDYIIEIAKRY